ncbi:replication initiation factor domain-containing protein [Janthinobacterium sp. LS2A]|uniref:replication initiation factor domain-containing protein n=1 Tax=Janthinobacterium sp. LS2A TaxID=3118590 RepID=UPI002F92BF42
MRPPRHSLIKRASDRTYNPYAEASGCSTRARVVEPQMHGVGEPSPGRADRADSAPALPVRSSAIAGNAGLVPNIAHVSATECSPKNNMGENLEGAYSDSWESVCDEDFGEVKLVLAGKGETKTLLVRRPSSAQCCVIDWMNFTLSEDTWSKTAGRTLISDEEYVEEASRHFEKIFGFGVTTHRGQRLNFYTDSWVLGDGMGFVGFGKQNRTMLIMLSGQGCMNAIPGWEKRLYDFLTQVAVRPSISRIDLAHDDFDGSYLSVDWAYQQWKDGGFNFRKGGRPPEIQKLGNWDRPSGKGRTLTIGQRTSSKYFRFYEKGKKEGDKSSLWGRAEAELKNNNTIIDMAVLLNPSSVFVGLYPCLAQFDSRQTPVRLVVKARAQSITIEDSIAITKRQFGKYIRVFRALFGDKETLDFITNEDENAFPKRLKPFLSFADSGPVPMHKETPVNIPEFIFIKSVPVFRPNGANGFA